MKHSSAYTLPGSGQAAAALFPDSARQSRAAQSMLAAMLIIGITDNAVPLMAEHIGLGQFYVLRTLVALPLLLLMARAGLGGLRPVRLGAVSLRALLLAVSMMFYFSAVALMPLAQALAGLFTSPIGHRCGLGAVSQAADRAGADFSGAGRICRGAAGAAAGSGGV